MTIYIISFVLNLLVGLLICKDNSQSGNDAALTVNTRKKIYLLITALQFGLLCGLRSTKMAYDTSAYKLIFDMCPDSWDHLFDRSSYVEIGFRLLCSVIKILGGNYQTMLIVTSLFIMGSCCVFIYRHSKDVILSVFIIISFPFFYSSFDIIRHFLATSFFLLGYKYIVERKFFKYTLFIFIGSLFHGISWVFLPFYFAKKIRWNWKTMTVATVGTVVIYAYIQPVATWISDLLGKSSGINSGWIDSYGGGIKTVIMYGVILLIAIIAFYQLENRTEEDMNAVNYVVLMLVFSIIFTNARMMTRMIMTMTALVAIAIPQLLDKPRTKSLRDYLILKIAFVSIGIGYHAFMLLSNWQNVVPYIPFWR